MTVNGNADRVRVVGIVPLGRKHGAHRLTHVLGRPAADELPERVLVVRLAGNLERFLARVSDHARARLEGWRSLRGAEDATEKAHPTVTPPRPKTRRP